MIISVSAAEQDKIRAMTLASGPLDAVKYAQQITGASLAQSKDLVDRIAAGAPVSTTPDEHVLRSSALADRARVVRESDGAVAAVRLVQNETGMSLTEAKTFVDALS
jgi:ribosomal protein L7/L12